jgi:hypothetical protein
MRDFQILEIGSICGKIGYNGDIKRKRDEGGRFL